MAAPQYVEYEHAGTIRVSPGDNPKKLYKHQEEAVIALNKKVNPTLKKPFGGLVVIPTGGGKTLTAVQWLLRNYIDQQKKVLWIAHRHELLDQAFHSVKANAYANLLRNRQAFNYRIISGIHDRPVNIRQEDDILFASKDSLLRKLDVLLDNWLPDDTAEVLLVIDEAHHAPAKTYRQLIAILRKRLAINFKITQQTVAKLQQKGLPLFILRHLESVKHQGIQEKEEFLNFVVKLMHRWKVGKEYAQDKRYEEWIVEDAIHQSHFSMLGLTATPFRTEQAEEGILGEIFPDNIVYKVDLDTLITRGILATPFFEELQTELDFTKKLTNKDIQQIQAFDLLGELATEIAENKVRNHKIVEQYVQNQHKYGQALVFAVNINHALVLDALFKAAHIRSDVTVSGIQDMRTKVTLSPQDNKAKIEKFRRGELQVLVNVNILTEGTDLPNAQTIFLTRPTTSTVLMMQMIGRGLRGKAAGGTEKAYLVSFIDDWKDKIVWANPATILAGQGPIPVTTGGPKRKMIPRFVPIEKIIEFAKHIDHTIDLKKLKALDFIQRIPIGVYAFSMIERLKNEDDAERNYEILVFDNIQHAYADFINELPDLFTVNRIAVDQEMLSDEELQSLTQQVEERYFADCEKYPGYRIEDIQDILRYYAEYEDQPTFIRFEERAAFDITEIAMQMFTKNLDERAQAERLKQIWEDEQTQWKAFFGYDFRYFTREFDLALDKLKHPGNYPLTPPPNPRDEKEQRELEKLSLWELRQKAPAYWKELRDAVFAKAIDQDGYYVSASGQFRYTSKIMFQIDHILPMSMGGRTVLKNLQLLTWWENLRKSDQFPWNQIPVEEVTVRIHRDYDYQMLSYTKIADALQPVSKLTEFYGNVYYQNCASLEEAYQVIGDLAGNKEIQGVRILKILLAEDEIEPLLEVHDEESPDPFAVFELDSESKYFLDEPIGTYQTYEDAEEVWKKNMDAVFPKNDFVIVAYESIEDLVTEDILIDRMVEKSGLTHEEAKRALKGLTELISDALMRYEKVTLIGFGTFSVVTRASRGRHPAKNVPKFTPGSALKEKVAGE